MNTSVFVLPAGANTPLSVPGRGNFVGLVSATGIITVRTDRGESATLKPDNTWEDMDPYQKLEIRSTVGSDRITLNYGFGIVRTLTTNGVSVSMFDESGNPYPLQNRDRNNINLAAAPVLMYQVYDFAGGGPGPTMNTRGDDLPVLIIDVTDTAPLLPWAGAVAITTQAAGGVPIAPLIIDESGMVVPLATITASGRYYVRYNGGTIVQFTPAPGLVNSVRFRISGSHAPMFTLP